MDTRSVKLVCFSPTGTTRRVVEAVARGINRGHVGRIDITLPEAREQQLETFGEELLVVGVPVYMGRVPALIMGWLQSIKAHNTPAVCVVVYGNRVYDNALLELKDTLTNCGARPVAAAAFVGEHSFSSDETPIAVSRPDAEDIEDAYAFGRSVAAKLDAGSAGNGVGEFQVPGSYPYGGVTELWNVDFIAVGNACKQCGICAEICPTGAIDKTDGQKIDIEKCITCCACIKQCPENARTKKPGPVMDAAHRLHTLFGERKKPVVFV